MKHQTIPQTDTDAAPLIALDKLKVGFDGANRPALHAISLSIAAGELIGLVGESGAGKTTLARAIMGKLKAPARRLSGEARFKGLDLETLSEDAHRALLGNRIAMIVANPRSELNPILTVGEQICNVLRAHQNLSPPQARARALQMLHAVRIPDPERRMNSYPHELSGGMAQRIVIAIALSCDPDFVISDDATSGLDVTVQNQVLSLIADMVADRGAAGLFITRDIAIAAHYCSRIAILYRGQIVETAPTEAFFNRPAHPYSMALLSAFAHSKALRNRWSMPEDAALAQHHAGCAFAARCPRRQARCLQIAPSVETLAPLHEVACHYPVRD